MIKNVKKIWNKVRLYKKKNVLGYSENCLVNFYLVLVRFWAFIKILECQNEDLVKMVRWYALMECVVKKCGAG